MLLGPILDGRPLLNEQFLGIIVQLDVEAIDGPPFECHDEVDHA